MCFKQMGRSVRSVSLRACEMTVNDPASFIRHFAKLERLSIIDPVAHSTVLDDSVEFPTLGGVLELQYLFIGRGIWDFVHQLSQLPLAFHTVVLEAIHVNLLAPVNKLLATCRETMTRVDIRDRAFSYFLTFAEERPADSQQHFRFCQKYLSHGLRCPSGDALQHRGHQLRSIRLSGRMGTN